MTRIDQESIIEFMPTRRSALLSLVSGTIGAGVCLGSQGRKQVAGSKNSLTQRYGSKTSLALSPIRFHNVAREAGLNFVLENNPTPEKHLIETMTGGIAVFDYNNDGLPDIFFANGAALPSMEKNDPKYFNRLYRNEGSMKFTDVTSAAGVAGAGYSMGAAAADYDNDGHVDLFVAGVNRNILYHNLGNGRFEDVSEKAGIKSDKWAVAAGWFDYNNDGLLDLWVVNYAKWSIHENRFCGDPSRRLRVYCHPMYFEGLTNTLYRNRGDGTFEDVSAKSGIAKYQGRGMSAAFADYDGDGFVDVFVTNDNQPNFLFHNRGDGTFEEVGLSAGVALLNSGQPVSSMGVDFRDYDNDGLPDIAVTGLNNETFPLFHNLGGGMFDDATSSSRLGVLSAARGGWGNGFFDLNNDGWKDLFTANSHADDNIRQLASAHYRQPNSIFANLGNGTFRDVSTDAGGDFQVPRAHRGCAFADFNQDGKIDVVISSLQDTAELWQNVSPNQNDWIILKLIGTRSNRDGIGARVRIGKQYNEMTTAVGYASSSHFGVHFGLGKMPSIEEIEIRWPSGIVQVLRNVSPNQRLDVREPVR
ncbi:MAG TPA: CRTAC1 family protein [Terriglobia bacterium]|nr:CRTAC1 family protein [Terriglobia bacterium]